MCSTWLYLTAIARRTVVAAARGGRLTRCRVHWDVLWKPCAVCELLPAWVSIKEWEADEAQLRRWDEMSLHGSYRDTWPAEQWAIAGVMLRRALFHMSNRPLSPRRLSTQGTQTRLLALANVHLMHHGFNRQPLFDGELPRLSNSDDARAENGMTAPDTLPNSSSNTYFLWLRDDVALAQQVLDAWNALVKCGDADLCPCYCRSCYSIAQEP